MSGRGGKVLDMSTVGERQTIKMEARSLMRCTEAMCLCNGRRVFCLQAATSSLLGLRSCSEALEAQPLLASVLAVVA